MTEEADRYYALNARVYSVLARFYDATVLPLTALRDQVVRASGASRSSRVLDVATGTGAQAFAFAKVCAAVVAIDISDAMLAVARRKRSAANVTYEHADATRLPFDDGSFDVAAVSFALHEMPPEIRKTALAEMVRVLRPGGTLVIADHARRPGKLGTVLHRVFELVEGEPYIDYLASDMPAILSDAGVRFQREERAVHGVARILVARKPAEHSVR